MGIIFDQYDKYSIKGKIIDINDGSTLTISVTSPFVSQIKFHCSSEHYDTLHPPISPKYDWIDWGRDDIPPIVIEASASYNAKEKCFYKKEFGPDSKWKRTDFKDIYDDNPHLLRKNMNMQEKYKLFLQKYMQILYKGQLCHFSAYAIYRVNRKWHSIQNTQVESNPDIYYWIYDPDTFCAEKWDVESIDGLVKEIRPSRDCLNQLLESYNAADQEAKRKAKKEKWDRRWKTTKSTPERVEDFIGKYPRLLWLIISFGTFLVGIGSFIVTYLKD